MQFVSKNRAATRFQYDHGDIPQDIRTDRVQIAAQIGLRHIEESVVIERPATAEMLIQYYDFASSLLQDFDRGLRCFRHEIVVERVCPQKDLGPGTRSRPALMKPILEGLGRERRNLPFLWNTRGHLRQRP